MEFRPCIDLHNGKVKQIVGSTLKDGSADSLKTNFTASEPSAWFSELYRGDQLRGGHIIKLGPGNDEAATDALAAWPGGMQVGGGITADNGKEWLDRGASHVIVTSYVFAAGQVDHGALSKLVQAVGKERLVIDLSCRRRGDDYYIVTDRWQKFTDVIISPEVLESFAAQCDEFLIHAADVEGQCNGIEIDLVQKLAQWSPIATTYAGGIKDMADMDTIRAIGRNRLHATVGSALDIFGGTGMRYDEAVAFHKAHADNG
jgi:phosphoribosylformimino-5-aminoimidazole carboxamide ribotide isomerase